MGQNTNLGFFGLIPQQHKARAASFSINVSPLITLQPISYFQPNISVVITCLHNTDVQGKQMPLTEAFACSHVVVLGWLSPCTQSLTGVCVCVSLGQPPSAASQPSSGDTSPKHWGIPAPCLAGRPKKRKQKMWGTRGIWRIWQYMGVQTLQKCKVSLRYW